MEKIKFSDLGLNIETGSKEIEFNGRKLEIIKYLPSVNKYNLLMTTLEESYENGIYNPFKVDVLFHLNLVLMYCSSFDYNEEDIDNPIDLYDKIKSNGLLDIIIDAIEVEEYEELWESLNELIAIKTQYNMTVAALLDKMQKELPEMMQGMQDIIKDFSPEQYQAVIDFASAANGGRDIETNQPVE